mmetsp:Transcript_26787/g.67311  ORF Transcript_26787/g.67311 Transcript_26787/m.67311 type:complete len:296 (-) Transcript_26787:100-987(-)
MARRACPCVLHTRIMDSLGEAVMMVSISGSTSSMHLIIMRSPCAHHLFSSRRVRVSHAHTYPSSPQLHSVAPPSTARIWYTRRVWPSIISNTLRSSSRQRMLPSPHPTHSLPAQNSMEMTRCLSISCLRMSTVGSSSFPSALVRSKMDPPAWWLGVVDAFLPNGSLDGLMPMRRHSCVYTVSSDMRSSTDPFRQPSTMAANASGVSAGTDGRTSLCTMPSTISNSLMQFWPVTRSTKLYSGCVLYSSKGYARLHISHMTMPRLYTSARWSYDLLLGSITSGASHGHVFSVPVTFL